ncbi:DUF2637 domain-containing protein [Humibacter albus]|jgi:hypothetical protein|uniref:DUF2637 domain-containing protein n=1 Tax=Humibacter albus TaxID=427754 RepID=UPI000A02F340|nr:DUF2637 domain-containing protein [Humibacter albus]
MKGPISLRSTSGPLNVGVAIGVAFLAAGAFSLSFTALRDLALRAGIDSPLAFAWPLIVDGFIVVATAAAFALKRRGRRVTWYPWAAVVLFSGLSIAGNALHALDSPSPALPVPVAAAVSSVPALALFIASHLLVIVIEAPAGGRPSPARRLSNAFPETSGTQAGAQVEKPQTTVPSPSEAVLLDRLRQLIQSGETITGATVARIAHVSDRTGRRRLEDLRDRHPDLFSLSTSAQ